MSSLSRRWQYRRLPVRIARNALVVACVSLVATLLLPASVSAETTLTSPAGIEGVVADGAIVALVNADTGRYLDADGNHKVNQSTTPKRDDLWLLNEVRPGIFTLANQNGRLLDGDGASNHYDVNLSRNHEADTEWEIIAGGDGTYELINVEYGQWLDADGADEHYNVNLSLNGDDLDVRWYIGLLNPDPDTINGAATVLIQNEATARWLDGDSATVDQSVFPKDDDLWVIEAPQSAGLTIRSIEKDRLLAGTADDVSLNGAGGLNTRWSVQQGSEGTFRFQNADSQLWLDGDYADQNFNVNLSANGNDLDARWNVLVLDTDLGCTTETFTSVSDVLLCVDAGDSFVHLEVLQAIADANGGTRQSGTPGYDASADYVAGLLQDAGLEVTIQEFDFTVFTPISLTLEADGVVFAEDQVFFTSFSGAGDIVNGAPVGIDFDLGLGNQSSSGCEAEDFAAVDFSGPADIAVVQRGACAFATKAINAADAGAEAVVIFNQGNTEDRLDPIGSTLGGPVVDIPVLDVSYDNGLLLSEATSVSIAAQATNETSTTSNVIADMPGRNPNNVVMAGAHLDSVPEGPGIQDNGSGSAAILTIALALANNDGFVPQNSLRFAWWGAEEAGLIGSEEYIFNPEFGISDEDYAALALYLNFDMIASPNYYFGVYDADESTFAAPAPVPPGSTAIEDVFEAYYSFEALPYDDSAFSGRSDYQAFINVGIPAGGLFTGAEGIKTDEQAAVWGGIVGDQFDQCYHLACDTFDNVSYESMEINGDAVAYAVFVLAGSTEAVNGVTGVDVGGPLPASIELDGAAGTFVDPNAGGGLAPDLHDHDHDQGEPE